MNRKILTFLVVGCLALIVAVTAGVMRFQANAQLAQFPMEKCMGGSGMMGDGMMGNNSQDMQIVHQLFAYHDQIRRSVDEIPGGIQTVTESDNPEVAALIQQHVASMHQRLEDGRWFAMMSRTLPVLFQNADRYQRRSQITNNGISVTKTSDNTELAQVLREHAEEVTQFVQDGMPCMDDGMMRNHPLFKTN